MISVYFYLQYRETNWQEKSALMLNYLYTMMMQDCIFLYQFMMFVII